VEFAVVVVVVVGCDECDGDEIGVASSVVPERGCWASPNLRSTDDRAWM
jgi:hypothetical protein